jgi:hypothetical protein
MIDNQDGRWDGLIAGIQLGIFEVIWPAFRWIKGIWVKKGGQVRFFIQVAELPGEEDWEDCQRLVKELLDVAAKSYGAELSGGYTIQYGLEVLQDQEYLELMSDRVFKQIAQEVAPWRLNSGR